jgi:hypothetical protein
MRITSRVFNRQYSIKVGDTAKLENSDTKSCKDNGFEFEKLGLTGKNYERSWVKEKNQAARIEQLLIRLVYLEKH